MPEGCSYYLAVANLIFGLFTLTIIAITRQVSPNIARCELTHLERQPVDYARAAAQHGEYEQALRSLGVQIIQLPAEANLPDSVFVEDAAIVLDELAVITRPGAASRRPETASIAAALQPYRPLLYIQPPATLDGGDVLRLGRQLFVGLSSRSTPAAIEQLGELLEPYGYCLEGLHLRDCLHLKSAVTQVAPQTLLINPRWLGEGELARAFTGWQIIEVDPQEPFGANCVWLAQGLIYPLAYPRTRARLESAGLRVVTVDASELAKAEGGVTCCSLLFLDNRSQ
jgi:dimethylargininase